MKLPLAQRVSPFRALRSYNYRLFFIGQSVSLVGTWFSRTATNWLVWRLTHSAWLLGVVGFAGQVPTLLLSPFAGVLVDRMSRHRVLVVTQTLALIQSAVLAGLALMHVVTIWEIAALAAIQGLINSFDTPARQSFAVQMVDDRAQLPSAIALNSSMVNVARLIGPSVAAWLIVRLSGQHADDGEGWCFVIDAVSYLAVLASLGLMRLKPEPRVAPKNPLQQLREGFRYTFGFGPIRAFLMLLASAGLLSMSYQVLLPVVADKLLHGGPHALGVLTGSAGAGALLGLAYLASRKSVVGLGRVTWRSTVVFGLGLFLLAASSHLMTAIPALMVVGAGMMVQTAGSNTVLQTLVEEDKRGRVMSFYTMAVLGTAPLGSLIAGAVAERWGARAMLLVGGASCFISALAFRGYLPTIRERVRPIYMKLGILPALAKGIAVSEATAPPEG